MQTHELARRLLEMKDCPAALTVYDPETEMFHDAPVNHIGNDMFNVIFICGEVTESYQEEK